MTKKKKERVFIVFDGSNFYNRLKEPPLEVRNQLFFNYKDFVVFLLQDRELVQARYYVGAIRSEKRNPKSLTLLTNQHKLFSHLAKCNVDLLLGYILKTDGYHEKGVDVQIAVDLLIGAYENLWDTVILLSSDTDLLPAIAKVRELGKNMEYVGFSHKPSFGMIRFATSTTLLKLKDLLPFTKNKK